MTDALLLLAAGPTPEGAAHRWRPSRGDVVVAALVTAVSVGSFLLPHPFVIDIDRAVPVRDPDAIGALEVATAGVALAWRRVHPGLVLVLCVASSVVRFGAGYPLALVPYAVVVAVYTVADRRPVRQAVAAAVATAAVLAAGAADLLVVPIDDDLALVVVAVFGACLAGLLTRLHRQHAALLEQQQRDDAALAVATERAGIARELHDVVASNVGIIAAHAGAAPGVVPGGERATLDTIAVLARETLADMRRLVGVWHAAGLERERAASLDDLEALVDRVRSLATDVRLRVGGPRVRLPESVELAAYRIVQESLTNALRHGPGATVSVDVTFGPRRLDIVVDDTGGRPAARSTTPGFGLAGLRQRAELNGGELVAGPTDGGFRVTAWLPTTRRRDRPVIGSREWPRPTASRSRIGG